MNLSKESSDDLGFVLSSIACQAITIDEFKEWVAFAIGNFNCPDEFIDLLEVEYMADVYKILRFTPTLSDREAIEAALYGIAYRRFHVLFDANVPDLDAKKALLQRGDVFERFRKTFPFIELK